VPNLKHIVYSDPRGMRKYDDPRLMRPTSSQQWAATAPRASPISTTGLVDATKGEDVAILCTTSGTTGEPETRDARRRARAQALRDYLTFDPKGPDDEYVSVLPLPWIMEQARARKA